MKKYFSMVLLLLAVQLLTMFVAFIYLVANSDYFVAGLLVVIFIASSLLFKASVHKGRSDRCEDEMHLIQDYDLLPLDHQSINISYMENNFARNMQ